MRDRLPVFLGVFLVMALSNAIVPVLPLFAAGTAAQGAIYSAYFLGAFLLVLPSGFLADRLGEVPLIRAGLVLTVVSGLLLSWVSEPSMVFLIRLVEGFGAGLFVPASLALLNSRPDHERMSGYFMALLNLGLLLGLLGTGWLVKMWESHYAGIELFTWVSFIPLIISVFMRGAGPGDATRENAKKILYRLKTTFSAYFWLWVSAVVIVGITGALTALYPEFTNLPPDMVSVQIAIMNISTIVAILLTSHAGLPPIPTIRAAGVAMAGAVALTFFTLWGFVLVGWLAGMVMISQLSFLARVEARQGVVMGLFNTAAYGGMTLLPFVSGLIAEFSDFYVAFAALACAGLLVAGTIGRCGCSP